MLFALLGFANAYAIDLRGCVTFCWPRDTHAPLLQLEFERVRLGKDYASVYACVVRLILRALTQRERAVAARATF